MSKELTAKREPASSAIAAIEKMENRRELVAQALIDQKVDLMASAGETVKNWSEEKQRDFTNQFAYHVCSDNNLDEVFHSAEGKRSIMDAFRRSLETGLQVGGKHAYLISQSRKVSRNPDKWVKEARFSIKAAGFIALFCGGSNPIFKDIKWGKVCDNDDFKTDMARGEVRHFTGLNRGKFAGFWVQIIKMSGEKQVFPFSVSDIEKWKSAAKDQSVWNKWYESMAEQACIRHAVSRYEDAKDLLGEAWTDEGSGEPSTFEQPDDISDRVPDIDISDSFVVGESDADPVEDPVVGEKTTVNTGENEKPDKNIDLF